MTGQRSTDVEASHRFPAFSDLLRENGKFERVSLLAEKMIIARQLELEMQRTNLSKAEMASRMGTSRAQLARVLNPSAQNVTLESLVRAARAVGFELKIELSPKKAA